jgi:hypothetical protein
MDRAHMLSLLDARLFLEDLQRRLNENVKLASNGRTHHQACPLGGLFGGMPVNPSGAPCWCGASDEMRNRRRCTAVNMEHERCALAAGHEGEHRAASSK